MFEAGPAWRWTAAVAAAALLAAATHAGDREAEIAALLARSAQTAPGSRESRALAGEMGDMGATLLAEGAIGPAIELLGEAHVLDEQNGLVLGQLTLAFVRAEDFAAARFYLSRAGARAREAPPDLYRSLGDACYEAHRLEDAAAAWSEAARLSGQDPAMLARLAKVRDELAVSRGQRSLATDHFVLFADPAVPQAVLSRAGVELEVSYGALAESLANSLEQPQIVVIYAGRSYFSLVSVPDWGSGVYDGKIRVAVAPGGEDDLASSRILAHELGHAMLRHASGDRAPAWLHEGFAQWSEGRRMPHRDLAAALGGAPQGSVAELEASLRGTLDRRTARAAYAQALSLVEHLVRLRGEGALTCIVARLKEGSAMEEALRAEAGMGEAEILESWRDWAAL